MKVLIVRPDSRLHILSDEEKEAFRRKLIAEASEGVIYLDAEYEYEVVEIDDIGTSKN